MALWGWWTGEGDSQTQQSDGSPQPRAQHVEMQESSTPTQPIQEPQPIQKPPPDDREAAAYEELRALFRSVAGDADDDDTLAPTPSSGTTAATTHSTHTRRHNLPTLPKLSAEDIDDSIYPSTLSCGQCFDLAYYCSSLGGQLNNVYRYGGLRSCSDLWAQWRFCMRTKAMGDAERRRRVREWNREKEVRRRMMRNSEEVWELRRHGEGHEEVVPALLEAAAANAAAAGVAEAAAAADQEENNPEQGWKLRFWR